MVMMQIMLAYCLIAHYNRNIKQRNGRNKMQSKIHHYEVLTQYGKEPIASFLEWNDAVAFAGCRDIRLIYK